MNDLRQFGHGQRASIPTIWPPIWLLETWLNSLGKWVSKWCSPLNQIYPILINSLIRINAFPVNIMIDRESLKNYLMLRYPVKILWCFIVFYNKQKEDRSRTISLYKAKAKVEDFSASYRETWPAALYNHHGSGSWSTRANGTAALTWPAFARANE